MFQLRIPSRPQVEPPARLVRYAVVATHTLREALEDYSATWGQALADKVAELEKRLEALDDDIDETPQDKEDKRRATTRKPRAKAKK